MNWQYKPLALRDAQAIAESFVGGVPWEGEIGFRKCPFEAGHSKTSGDRDLKVVAAKKGELPPGFYCWHGSCRGQLDDLSTKFRSELGKRQPLGTTPFRIPANAKWARAAFDAAKLQRLAAKLGERVTREWLWTRSPIQPDNRTPASYLDAISKLGDKHVIFSEKISQGQAIFENRGHPFNAQQLDAFATGCPEGVWFLTNPSDCQWRRNDDGNLSRRSWQNIVDWRHLLIESDKAEVGPWLAALEQRYRDDWVTPLSLQRRSDAGGCGS